MTGARSRRWRVQAGAAVAVLVLGCGKPAPLPAPAARTPPGDAWLEVHRPRLVGTDDRGRVRWELRADSVKVDRGQRVTAERPRGYLVSEGGRRVQVHAGRALYDRAIRRLELQGGVRVEASAGRWLVAQAATYEAAGDLLVARGGVQLQADGWEASADRLESRPTLRRVRLAGNVHVRGQPR